MGKKIYIYANETELKWKTKVATLNPSEDNEVFIFRVNLFPSLKLWNKFH